MHLPWSKGSSLATYVLIALLCFNNVTDGLLGRDCFHYATLEPSPPVSTNIFLRGCYLVANADIDNRSGGTIEKICITLSRSFSYYPPFMYSYGCSSSLVTSFATVFLFRYAWPGIVYPAGQSILDFVLRYHSQHQQPAQAHKRTHYLEMLQAPRWRYLRTQDVLHDSLSWQFNAKRMQNSLHTPPPLSGNDVTSPEVKLNRQDMDSIVAMTHWLRNSVNPAEIFDRRRVVALFVADLLVLMTFGVLLPPLAVVISWSMVVDCLDHIGAIRGLLQRRYRYEHLRSSNRDREEAPKDTAQSTVSVDPLHESEFRHTATNLSTLVTWAEAHLRDLLHHHVHWEMLRALWMLRQVVPGVAVVVASFWAFTLFDTFGGQFLWSMSSNASQFSSFWGVWIALVAGMVGFPVLWLCLCRLTDAYQKKPLEHSTLSRPPTGEPSMKPHLHSMSMRLPWIDAERAKGAHGKQTKTPTATRMATITYITRS
jgi:hypothetical protein